MSEGLTIRTELRPGDLGRIASLHGEVYATEPGIAYGVNFEAYVCRTLADFVIENGAAGRVFLAEREGALVGCAAMVDRSGKGQLRWVLVAPNARGTGLGKTLVGAAMDYATERGWPEVYLETTSGLPASMSIYEKLGFKMVSETPHDLWDSGGQSLIIMTKAMR
ncbi:MAG: GNAT family N-acetyltransferase [Parvularculaceae bacterium]